MKHYTDILRELREDADMTQAAVAAVLGTTQQVYARYEKGLNALPLHHLRTLCQLYEVSADYILGLPQGLHWPRGSTITPEKVSVKRNSVRNEQIKP